MCVLDSESRAEVQSDKQRIEHRIEHRIERRIDLQESRPEREQQREEEMTVCLCGSVGVQLTARLRDDWWYDVVTSGNYSTEHSSQGPSSSL